MWLFTIRLCFRVKFWRRRGLMLASLVSMLLLFGLIMYEMSNWPISGSEQEECLLRMNRMLYASYAIHLVVVSFALKWFYQGLDGSYLWSTWIKDRQMFRARKKWSKAVEDFSRIESVSRYMIKIDGLDYGEFFRRLYGLAPDDPYLLKHYPNLSTKYDRMLRHTLEYERMCSESTSEPDSGYRGYSHRSKGYRPDEWRKDIPYSDPFDSHLSATAPDHLDRDGDGYIDGTVGDGGYES